ncbi:unnamed protein product [Orchesella dallaii]|uniref:C2H2-type domain-containing protein n=1 Tax=Orchesella dallaii TaxID=48710 RepID=A0ABP1QWC4_9HEXA
MEVLQLKSCIVCSKPHPSFIKSELQSKLIMSSLLPGSNGSVVFNNQLCMYFISKKLLNFTDDECMRFIAHFQNNPTTGWCQVFCEKCGVYVGQALDLHKKMLMLAGKIDELAITLQSHMKGSNSGAYFDEIMNSDVDDDEEEDEENDYEYSVGGSTFPYEEAYDPPECISLEEDDERYSTLSVEEDVEVNADVTIPVHEDDLESTTSKDDSVSIESAPPPLIREEYPRFTPVREDIQSSPEPIQSSSVEDDVEDDALIDDHHREDPGDGDSIEKTPEGTSSTTKGSERILGKAKNSEVAPPEIDAYSNITSANIPDDVLEALFRMQFSESSSDEMLDNNDEKDKEWKPNRKLKFTKRSTKTRKVTPKKKVTSGENSNVRKSVRKSKPSLRMRNVVADIVSHDTHDSHDSVVPPTRRVSNAGSSSTSKTEKAKGILICNRCPTKYKKAGQLARHLRVHKECDEMNNEFDCKVCGFPCISKKNFRRHNSYRHQAAEYKCDECGYIAPEKARLERHKEIHKLMIGSKEFQCDVCNESFGDFITISRHRRQVHSSHIKLSVFKCDKCDGTYSTLRRLQNHISQFHDPIITPTCQHCGKVFRKTYDLKEHMKVHEPKERLEVCEYCGVDFMHSKTLRAHIRKFHSESTTESVNSTNNEEPVYKCKHCEFTSHLRLIIMRHRKIHSNIYRYPCDICGKGYTKPYSLKLHQQTTHGEGKNTVYCKWCQKKFIHQYYLKYHLERCKKRPDEDKAKELLEKKKRKRKSTSSSAVVSPTNNLTSIPMGNNNKAGNHSETTRIVDSNL